MTWPASLLVSLLTGGLGLLAAGLVMNACVTWYRISSFEGKAGYAVVFAALLGGVLGVIVGLVVARLTATGGLQGFGTSLGIAAGVVLGAAGLTAATARLLADVPPRIDGQELMLEVEVRLPVDVKDRPASTGKAELSLHSVSGRVARASRRGELRLGESRLEGGRWIVPGSVFLFTGRGKRTLSFEMEGQPLFGFFVPLPARPSRAHESWSEWGPCPPAPHPPWPDTKPSFRFRVQKIAA